MCPANQDQASDAVCQGRPPAHKIATRLLDIRHKDCPLLRKALAHEALTGSEATNLALVKVHASAMARLWLQEGAAQGPFDSIEGTPMTANL
eukprot:CAMPEP_0115527656 /NCGR_PEP_ID=MMETSP0271-20121206/82962_1 /TAXON_ID=71861 /ORGANISM="Scrippsiella trochoidea, Strain CCMP3099" /LENGTH=91 /DNA_ID=CAMNT_0002959501 /DNA_START=196 /DNA_END=467 /DNA_ORIENTATION=-